MKEKTAWEKKGLKIRVINCETVQLGDSTVVHLSDQDDFIYLLEEADVNTVFKHGEKQYCFINNWVFCYLPVKSLKGYME